MAQNFMLRFGKHKGMMFFSTPKSYQTWLLKQDWFKMPQEQETPSIPTPAEIIETLKSFYPQINWEVSETSTSHVIHGEILKVSDASKKISTLSKQLNGWNGHSRKGEAIYDAIFEAEMQEMDELDPIKYEYPF